MNLLNGDAMAAQLSLIYEAAVTPERWVDVLAGLRERFHLTFATVATYSADRSHVDARAVGIAQADYDAFLDKYFRDNEFSRETMTRRAGSVVPSRSFIDPDVFQRSDMYQEFHRARDMGEGLRLDAWHEGGMYRSIAFFRPWSLGPYETAELAFCRALMPHLERATALNHRLRQADLLADAARGTLDVLPQAIFLLDGRALRYANAAAEQLLGAGDGLRLRHGLLYAASHADAAGFDAALARATGRHGPPAATALRLPKRAGAPLSLLVVPFPSEAPLAFGARPAVLVCAIDPDRSLALRHADLIDLFGLTAAEAALANDLLSGAELHEIAARSGRSVNTLRTHLARLMAKTGANRQSRLVQLLAALPRR
jgi:DNA-binding CsgD family transcriptional regulator/PAS domain-containing protein